MATKSQAYGYKARYGGKLPKLSSPGTLTGQELAAHQEAMNIIDAPLTPGSAATGGQMSQSGTGFVEGDYFNQDMGTYLEGLSNIQARRKS